MQERSTGIKIAVLGGLLLLAAVLGAALYSLVGGNENTTTIVRSPALLKSPQANAPVANQRSSLSIAEIYKRDAGSVVEITVRLGSGSGGGQAQGSGFVYDNSGNIVTNQHVVDGASSVSVLLADGSTRSAKVVGSDASTDVAVIKVDPSGLSPIQLADSETVEVGDTVVAIGSPMGLENSVSSGIVSALGRQITSPNSFTVDNAIQTDAAINHGSSGGPVLDSQGHVIGIATQIDSSTGSNDGIAFAVPSNTIRSVANQIIAHGKASHPYLGVSIVTVTPAIAKKLNLHSGVEIARALSGGPAAKAGLKGASSSKNVNGQPFPVGGDVIVSIGGKATATSAKVQSVIAGYKPGDKVTVTFYRNGEKQSKTVTLGTRPS